MASFLERDWAACITVTIELRNNRGRTHRRTDRSIARVDVRVELCRNPGVGSELPIFRAHALLSGIPELRPMPVSHTTFHADGVLARNSFVFESPAMSRCHVRCNGAPLLDFDMIFDFPERTTSPFAPREKAFSASGIWGESQFREQGFSGRGSQGHYVRHSQSRTRSSAKAGLHGFTHRKNRAGAFICLSAES